jgi:leucyl aminopeptidase
MRNFYLLCSALFLFQLPVSAHLLDSQEKLTVEEIYERLDISPSGETGFITIGNDSLEAQGQSLHSMGLMQVVRKSRVASIIEVDKAALPAIGEVNHQQFKRCAGYFFHNTLKEAQEHIAKMERMENASKLPASSTINRTGFQNSRTLMWGTGGDKPTDPRSPSRADYNINQQNLVKNLTSQVEELNIRNSILKLSSYKNRYYQSATGVEAAEWIASHAKSISKHRNDVSVELFKHTQWAQPSVIVTIKGTSAETIVIGGHLDSISGFSGGDTMAPGADDNASGISTWLEVLRILLANNYQPQKTIQFMGYAAEEVGLRGSNEIAKKYNANKVPVVGVVQLDMTNFKGAEKSIYLMTDFTNEAQNTFVGSLIDEYVKVPWGFDKCGYGCSDHASWHGQGYPASMPFEATMRGMNRNIHTPKDKLDISGNNASHAVNFAKLAIAFAVELDR